MVQCTIWLPAQKVLLLFGGLHNSGPICDNFHLTKVAGQKLAIIWSLGDEEQHCAALLVWIKPRNYAAKLLHPLGNSLSVVKIPSGGLKPGGGSLPIVLGKWQAYCGHGQGCHRLCIISIWRLIPGCIDCANQRPLTFTQFDTTKSYLIQPKARLSTTPDLCSSIQIKVCCKCTAENSKSAVCERYNNTRLQSITLPNLRKKR